MKQLTQKLRSGDMEIQELPIPQLGKGMVLVQNHYSLISAGTEGATVSTARKSLIGKAKERPQQVMQVLDTLKKQGPVQTYRAVMKKLDAYSPLGYSSAGVVIAVGSEVSEFAIGDKVACAGVGYANHAELVAVPTNLTIKLAQNADLKQASYNTLGAIALQGIRQADMRLGETCVVIGLGLLGQLTGLMLQASGVKVIGVDINEAAVKTANEHATDISFARNEAGLEEKIMELTNGKGVDTVIIAAATSSTDPINFAGSVARKKGKIIILGDVSTAFDRNPHWYKKELELKMACSYGPGRYDLNYEEKGQDYPYAYVRWTEKRNMQAFQELIQSGKINLEYLSTHEFSFDDTPKAYDMVADKSEPFLGIALKYDIEKKHSFSNVYKVNSPKAVGKINIGFIGAGSYAQGNLLPNIPLDSADIVNKSVLTNNGTTSKRVADKFKFETCTDDEKNIFNKDINTVFVATRHDSHAKYVIKALQNNQNVFVEKPICLTKPELVKIEETYSKLENPINLMIGFNRRFSPLSVVMKEKIGEGPMAMIYRVNAGNIPADTWIQDLEIGGGRIIGEACHFIDYLTWLNGSLPTGVFASAMPDAEGLNDTVNINITFANGSTGVVAYYANGSKELAKEYIEVYRAGSTAILTDFKALKVYGKKTFNKKLINQDKGQSVMMEKYLSSIKDGEVSPISYNEITAVTNATFAVIKSIEKQEFIKI